MIDDNFIMSRICFFFFFFSNNHSIEHKGLAYKILLSINFINKNKCIGS